MSRAQDLIYKLNEVNFELTLNQASRLYKVGDKYQYVTKDSKSDLMTEIDTLQLLKKLDLNPVDPMNGKVIKLAIKKTIIKNLNRMLTLRSFIYIK
jgi:hypothetical protein